MKARTRLMKRVSSCSVILLSLHGFLAIVACRHSCHSAALSIHASVVDSCRCRATANCNFQLCLLEPARRGSCPAPPVALSFHFDTSTKTHLFLDTLRKFLLSAQAFFGQHRQSLQELHTRTRERGRE